MEHPVRIPIIDEYPSACGDADVESIRVTAVDCRRGPKKVVLCIDLRRVHPKLQRCRCERLEREFERETRGVAGGELEAEIICLAGVRNYGNRNLRAEGRRAGKNRSVVTAGAAVYHLRDLRAAGTGLKSVVIDRGARVIRHA